MRKPALGRGLDALLGTPEREGGEPLLEVPVEQVVPNPNQPRKTIDPAGLEELARSIRANGVLQPVVVRRYGSHYQLVAGERRWRAARLAGLARVPAVLRDVSEAESLELALVENLLREDLNPVEAAEGYQRLIAEFGWTQEELAERIGRDRSSVANTLRLLRLPGTIQDDLRQGRLTMGHARALLALTSEAEQVRLRDRILEGAWSVRATEAGVRARRPRRGRAARRSAELAALQEALQRSLMTRVRIRGGDRRGQIEITYATAEELERLAERLGGKD